MFNKKDKIKSKKEEFDKLIQIYDNSPMAKGICLDYRHHLVNDIAFGYDRPVIVFRKQCGSIKAGELYGDYYHIIKVIHDPLNNVDSLVIIERNPKRVY